MFVKLSFTADKNFVYVRQILNAIINDVNINSAATLATAAASWHPNIVASLDYTNSEIIRTVEPTTVKSHYADDAPTLCRPVWTLEFQVYDAPSRKYYISFDNLTGSDSTSTLAGITTNLRIGDTILSGSMTANQASMSVDILVNSTVSGTPVILSSTAPAQLLANGSTYFNTTAPNNSSNIRTWWMYLTNDCLIMASTNGTSSNLGFNATYNNNAAYSGPWIFSQYQRYDYHNTDANGVIPLMFTNISRINNGSGPIKAAAFGWLQNFSGTFRPDWNRTENVNLTTDTAFRVFNFIDAHPQVGTSWPLTSFPTVNWGSGTRFTDAAALDGKSALDSATSTSAQIPRLIHTTSQTRFPSSDLRTVGYGMLPLSWSNSYRFNRGGNATARGGFYIFNGDYFPGDTFAHGGKTYMIWPTYNGYTDRVGVAVPKE